MFEAKYALVEREQLLDVLSGRPAQSLKGLPFPVRKIDWRDREHDTAVGYWERPKLSLAMPDFLIIADGNERELLAWIDTYCANAAPISQWCRVYTESTIRHIDDPIIPSKLGKLSAAWAGAIIGECVVQMGGRGSVGELSLTAVMASHTFPIARANALWSKKISLDTLVPKLEKAASLLNSTPRRLSPTHLAPVWKVLGTLNDASSQDLSFDPTEALIRNACEEIHSSGAMSTETLGYFAEVIPKAETLIKLDELTAEQRVEVFDELTDGFRGNVDSRDALVRLTEFLMGFLANRVGSGGTGHLKLLYPWVNIFPLSPVWFGVNSALWKAEVWGSQYGGLGRLVQRELKYSLDIREQPRADISFDELTAAVDPEHGGFVFDFRGAAVRTFSVEIAPGVLAGYAAPSQKATEAPQADPELTGPNIKQISSAVETAIMTLTNLRSLLLKPADSTGPRETSVGDAGSSKPAKGRKRKYTRKKKSEKQEDRLI